MQYNFRIHTEDDGYWAECIELEGCQTQGNTIEELRRNAKEALNLYLDEPVASNLVFPPPGDHDGPDVISVGVEPELALSALLRNYRKKYNFTQKDVADRLGMKNLYSYQRLERRSNPNLNTLSKLKRVFPELSLDAVIAE